ncbi:MAG: winged helix-turn-helix transcriptional regulator [Clostridia bacterium]|nr:winged helix-turn-helix transcriptional regulator [Clostridia bacterium]MBO5671048.1 winged helix-turn-helix transcriptional regulator [Clostridia bacterium]
MCHTSDEKKHLCCVVAQLMKTERMHRAVVDSRVSALGIHRRQHSILREIARAQNQPDSRVLSQKDIAQRFGVSAAAVAMMMKKMEAEGYISRKMSSNDNRFNELYLTELGQSILSQSHEIFREIDAATYKGISEEDLTVFMRCLEQMQENLSAMPELDGKGDLPAGRFAPQK